MVTHRVPLQRVGAVVEGDDVLHKLSRRIMHYIHYVKHRSMQSTDIIDTVNAVLRSTRTRQRELAEFCRVTQGHVSKVLSRKVPPSAGLEADLADWLVKADSTATASGSELEEAMSRLRNAPEEHRMHILHILTNLSALV